MTRSEWMYARADVICSTQWRTRGTPNGCPNDLRSAMASSSAPPSQYSMRMWSVLPPPLPSLPRSSSVSYEW